MAADFGVVFNLPRTGFIILELAILERHAAVVERMNPIVHVLFNSAVSEPELASLCDSYPRQRIFHSLAVIYKAAVVYFYFGVLFNRQALAAISMKVAMSDLYIGS